MTDLIIFISEIIGTIAFSISGAMVAIEKKMDIFGVAMLGLTTAVGGGVIRDLILGATPPAMFRNPIYALTAVIAAIIIFIPPIRNGIAKKIGWLDKTIMIMDAIGLGIFTVVGIEVAKNLPDTGRFLQIFVGVVTGVGGGILRDIMSGHRPWIFVADFYACASIVGAIACTFMWDVVGAIPAMALGTIVIFVLRIFAIIFGWKLPKS